VQTRGDEVPANRNGWLSDDTRANLVRRGLAARRRVVIASNDWRPRAARQELARRGDDQRKRFEERAGSAAEVFRLLEPLRRDAFVVDDWVANMDRLEVAFLPRPPFDFLRDATVLATMVILTGGNVLERELDYLRTQHTGDQLRALLAEEPVGDPIIMEREFATSHQTIHHAYHLARFEATTGVEVSSLDRMVEWGAGYGGMARIQRRLHGGRPTQVLIDLPVFCLVQWLYLTTVFGEDTVSLITAPDQVIEPGRISIVPVGLVDAVPDESDLFLSTWAVSESTAAAQDHVVARKWFGANHLLLGFQESSMHFPSASRIGDLAAVDGAKIEPVEVLRGSRYAFR
jgi:hypothetical protein